MISDNKRLKSLRASMKRNRVDLYIISGSDPHLGEYLPDHWRVIEWLTSFTGSSATLIVTGSFAGLWTDSRYFLQAEKQLPGSGFVLMKPSLPDNNDPDRWLCNNVSYGDNIALDGRTFSCERIRSLRNKLKDKNISVNIDCDLISAIWKDRPGMPCSAAFDHPVEFAGKERIRKISEVRREMEEHGAEQHLLTTPDDIMWLLNIRGKDIEYTPLLFSYAVINKNEVILFADLEKIPDDLASSLRMSGVTIFPYEEIQERLSLLPQNTVILINPDRTPASLCSSIPSGADIREGLTIPSQLKAVKNNVEVSNILSVMKKDGVALTKFYYWLENNCDTGSLTELILSEKLNNLRAEQENYLGPSFKPIVAINENAAMPHYSPTLESDTIVGSKGILLVDSGGQYLDGTTDITRTISLGIPTLKQKRDFTYVLKGNIALAMAKFPAGTRGSQVDMLARKSLWENGLDYGHGTGHGVGFCLSVHESPPGINPGKGNKNTAGNIIKQGMLISDEPAIYRKGEYGIRTENLVLCYEDENTEFGQFLKFITVSLCYIDKKLIQQDLLDEREIKWINFYHAGVFDKIAPFLSDEEKKWLEEKTSPI